MIRHRWKVTVRTHWDGAHFCTFRSCTCGVLELIKQVKANDRIDGAQFFYKLPEEEDFISKDIRGVPMCTRTQEPKPIFYKPYKGDHFWKDEPWKNLNTEVEVSLGECTHCGMRRKRKRRKSVKNNIRIVGYALRDQPWVEEKQHIKLPPCTGKATAAV